VVAGGWKVDMFIGYWIGNMLMNEHEDADGTKGRDGAVAVTCRWLFAGHDLLLRELPYRGF